MLLLRRKLQERISIGDEIVVTIVRIGKNNVGIGIEAPVAMNIRRLDPTPHTIKAKKAKKPKNHPRLGELGE